MRREARASVARRLNGAVVAGLFIMLAACAQLETFPMPDLPADPAPPQAPLVVEGTLTDEGVECPALRTDNGTLYTLAVTNLEYAPGTRVRVVGSRTEAGTCMQGITIDVDSIEER